MMRHAVLALCTLALVGGPVRAQTAWADKLFLSGKKGHLSHDFGTVPRGQQLKHRFYMKNIYKVPLEITEIRVSCGCVSWTPTKALIPPQFKVFRLGGERPTSTNVLQPNEEGFLDINMDTQRFTGSKTVSIYFTVGPEFISTATLRVSANSRGDVVFNPGTVNFGIVHAGQTPTQNLDVEYSGALDWRILEVIKNRNAPFQVKVEELPRYRPSFRNPGRAGYRFVVTLKKDAPAGPFNQEMILRTNDPASPTLTVTVEGTVLASLAVNPNPVRMGTIKVGQAAKQKVLVSSQDTQPFQITSVEGVGDGITVEIPPGTASRHVLTIQCQPTRAGLIRKQLTIRTGQDQATVTVEANGAP